MNYGGLSGFCIKLVLFFKNFKIPDFQSIEAFAQPIEIVLNFFGLNLPGLIGARLMLDRSNLFFD